jgi:hypothetical protein
MALSADESKYYVGGNFTSVASFHNGAKVDASGNLVSPWALVGGTVHAAVADGSGGAYIAGTFTRVGQYTDKPYLAHISADGTVDASWPLYQPSGTVLDMIKVTYQSTDYLFICGNPYIDKLVMSDGSEDTGFAPSVSGAVTCLAASSSYVYGGGGVSTFFGSNSVRVTGRFNISNANSGTTSPTLLEGDVASSGTIYSICVGSGDVVYFGGNFTADGTTQLVRTTGDGVTVDNGFNASIGGGYVSDILLSGSSLYIHGTFSSAGGQSRHRIAIVNASSGSADTGFNPTLAGTSSNYNIYGWALESSILYLTGNFKTVNSTERIYTAALNSSGVLQSWYPGGGGRIVAVLSSSPATFYVGAFTFLGNYTPQSYVAAFSTADNSLDANFTPSLNSWPAAIALATLDSNSYVYLGGDFTEVEGNSSNKRGMASYMEDGTHNTYAPNFNNDVMDICLIGDGTTVAGSRLIVVGYFTNATHVINSSSVAIDYGCGLYPVDSGSNTVELTAWDPQFSSGALACCVYNSIVYCVGSFTTVNGGGTTRNRAAAWDFSGGIAGAGTLTSWDPNLNSTGYAVATDGTHVYIGGSFTTVGGTSHSYICRVDMSGVLDTSWNPASEGSGTTVWTIRLTSSHVHYGGYKTVRTVSKSTGDVLYNFPLMNLNKTVRDMVVASGMNGFAIGAQSDSSWYMPYVGGLVPWTNAMIESQSFSGGTTTLTVNGHSNITGSSAFDMSYGADLTTDGFILGLAGGAFTISVSAITRPFYMSVAAKTRRCYVNSSGSSIVTDDSAPTIVNGGALKSSADMYYWDLDGVDTGAIPITGSTYISFGTSLADQKYMALYFGVEKTGYSQKTFEIDFSNYSPSMLPYSFEQNGYTVVASAATKRVTVTTPPFSPSALLYILFSFAPSLTLSANIPIETV